MLNPPRPPSPPGKDLPPAQRECPQTLFSNRFGQMISQIMWNPKFLFSFPLHFFEGWTPFPQGGNAWGRGGEYEKNAFDRKFLLTNIVARIKVTLWIFFEPPSPPFLEIWVPKDRKRGRITVKYYFEVLYILENCSETSMIWVWRKASNEEGPAWNTP